MNQQESLQKAGSVNIKELKLISSDNTVFDLSDFIVELNIYEDIFSNYLKGSMLITDSRNLIENAPLIGEEYLVVKLQTPSFPSVISKTFRVYKVSDREIVKDNNTQNYVLHFASIELFYDILLPLSVSFEGSINSVVERIFVDYIETGRDYQISELNDNIQESIESTPLVILNAVANKVKFVSPGWSPFKCINWLASKAIPENLTSKNFIFFESNKSFYFGSLEYIFKEAIENNLLIGTYFVSAANIRDGKAAPNINREFFIAKDVISIENTDHVKNYTSGYLANRLVYLDMYRKNYSLVDYDYVEDYKNQYHTSGEGTKAKPIFTPQSLRNYATNINFYPSNPKLFDNFDKNISEVYGSIHGNRKSSLLGMTNLKMNITVPGRTDVEVGKMLYFSYPDTGGTSQGTLNKEDSQYSGYYLITAIHHKVNKIEHTMTMEIIKDSLTLKRD